MRLLKMDKLLDNINKEDLGDVYKSIETFPKQIEQVWDEFKNTNKPKECSLAKNVVIAGMGGSALGGRVVDSLIQDRSRVPIEVFTEYHLPNYVNKDTLVILSSYSGNTEETLSDANEAIKRGAKIFAITTGGKLEKLVLKEKLDSYVFNPINNPSKQPRMALGYSIASILSVLSQCDFIHLHNDEIRDVIKNFKEYEVDFGNKREGKNNISKSLAKKIKGKIPILVASEHLVGSAHTFKNQLNETSKNFSVLFDIPELNHHLMEGLGHPALVKKDLYFIFFESNKYTKRVSKRYPITQEVVEKNGVSYGKYVLKQETKLDQIFELISLGLYTSFYLSRINSVDPTKIPWVDYFKDKLSS
ncbi:bifunctional phosphoglucose/phosphomannose isomerase [Patescibacteria group bacterium]